MDENRAHFVGDDSHAGWLVDGIPLCDLESDIQTDLLSHGKHTGYVQDERSGGCA